MAKNIFEELLEDTNDFSEKKFSKKSEKKLKKKIKKRKKKIKSLKKAKEKAPDKKTEKRIKKELKRLKAERLQFKEERLQLQMTLNAFFFALAQSNQNPESWMNRNISAAYKNAPLLLGKDSSND